MNTVIQIGVTPRKLLQQIAMNRALLGIISLVYAYWFRRVGLPIN